MVQPLFYRTPALFDGQLAMALTEISEQVGYGNVMTMIRAFKRYENTIPSKYREDF